MLTINIMLVIGPACCTNFSNMTVYLQSIQFQFMMALEGAVNVILLFLYSTLQS